MSAKISISWNENCKNLLFCLAINNDIRPPMLNERPRFSKAASIKLTALAPAPTVTESPIAVIISISPLERREHVLILGIIHVNSSETLPGRSLCTESGTVALLWLALRHGNEVDGGKRFWKEGPSVLSPVSPFNLIFVQVFTILVHDFTVEVVLQHTFVLCLWTVYRSPPKNLTHPNGWLQYGLCMFVRLKYCATSCLIAGLLVLGSPQ